MKAILESKKEGKLTASQEFFSQHYLPTRPLASKNFQHGVRRIVREKALTSNFKYLEANPNFSKNIIAIDYDKDDSSFGLSEALEEGLPTPNIFIENPATSHAHLLYFIKTGVGGGSEKAENYFKYVKGSLTENFGGDLGYSNKFIRSPFYHPSTLLEDRLYTLKELDAYSHTLSSKTPFKTHSKASESILSKASGRNVSAFEILRKKAYRFYGKYYDSFLLQEYLFEEAKEIQASFKTPLSPAEIKGIVKSITKFCINNFSKENFSKIQAARSKKRWENHTIPLEDILEMRAADFTFKEIGEALEMKEATIKTIYYRNKKI